MRPKKAETRVWSWQSTGIKAPVYRRPGVVTPCLGYPQERELSAGTGHPAHSRTGLGEPAFLKLIQRRACYCI